MIKAMPAKAGRSAALLRRQECSRRDRAAAPSLRAAHPQLARLRVELCFQASADNIAPASQQHALYPPAAAFFKFPCPYLDCDGMFDLTAAVAAALGSDDHHNRGTLICSGQRAHDQLSGRSCGLCLTYQVIAEGHSTG